ncbi:MAG: hypothetical protein JXR73_06355 [Candidatus Omnitrophica bacterium]|nr:hypothetical protein [Candidatus Omnitrophota bacterium]
MWNSWKRFWTIDDPQSMGARLVLKPAMDGLRLIGKEVREFFLDRSDAALCQMARRDVLSHQPDAILLANHPSSVFLNQIGLDSAPCPVLVWLFDDPLLMGNEPFDDKEIVLVTDPQFEAGARQRGAKQVYFLPAAAPDHISANFQEQYAAPINYVGSIHINPKARAGIPPELRGYLKAVIGRKVESPEMNFEEILTRFPLAPGKQIAMTGPLHYFLYTEANRQSRLHFLRALAPHVLRIYGNEMWKDELKDVTMQNCFRGRLDPFLEYPDVIYSSDVTINLRSLQGFRAPTHRDFLAPRLGGFLLSSMIHEDSYDWKSVDPQNLYHLQEFPWSHSFRRPAEMAESASRFLADPQKRKDWIELASREIHLHHLYSQRMIQFGELLDSVGVNPKG